MVLKPQDVYVVLKILASGFRAPYAQFATELAMSPSEVHASVKRAQSAKLIHGPETPEPSEPRSFGGVPGAWTEVCVPGRFAGNAGVGYSGDGGLAVMAGLEEPSSIALDGSGNVFVGDALFRIRRVDAQTGVITTVAGNGTAGLQQQRRCRTPASRWTDREMSISTIILTREYAG